MDNKKPNMARVRRNAKKLGVKVKESKVGNYKIDVLKDGKVIARVGDKRYNDYTSYLKISKELADKRRRLYKIRHEKTRKKVGSRSYYADKLLWD